MKVVIRPTKFSDIPQLMKLNQETLPENYTQEFWSQKFYEGKSHSFVAVHGGEVIGYAFCDKELLISFALNEKFRNKGIGKQLLYHCLNTFTTPVSLHVRVSNEVALKLYKSVGFKEDKKIDGYYVNPVEDAFEMKWEPTGIKYKETKKLKVK